VDITNPHIVRSAFLNTYAEPSEPHPYRRLEQYDLVMTHRENEPNMGARRLSRRLELSEALIDGWLKGSKPHGYRTAETLAELGWFDLAWDGEQFRALNELIAWVYSSGAINDSYRVKFVFDDAEMRSDCVALVEQAGVREHSAVATGRDDRPNEIHITDPGAAAGRLFVGFGAPRRRKSSQRFGLPPYLAVAPDAVRHDFAARYLANRGVEQPNYAERVLVVKEQRPEAYLQALTGLFASVTDGEVRRAGESAIHLGPAAVDEILRVDS
jgi:hypothetical protein